MVTLNISRKEGQAKKRSRTRRAENVFRISTRESCSLPKLLKKGPKGFTMIKFMKYTNNSYNTGEEF